MSWITNKCWEYQLDSFAVDVDETNYFLLLKGIDTIATVYLNGKYIGSTRNALRSHLLPVESGHLSKSGNTVRVVIDSALRYAKAQAAVYPYEVPATQNYNVWAEVTHRSFVRKAGSDFGWDWGPAFVPSGITDDVLLIGTSSSGYLDGLSIIQKVHKSLSKATLEVRIDLSAVPTKRVVDEEKYVSVYLDDKLVLSRNIRIPPPSSTETARYYSVLLSIGFVDVEAPALWWPRGMGAQHMYKVQVVYDRNQNITRKIGIRTVELVQVNFSHSYI